MWLILNCSVNAGKEISDVSYDCEYYNLIFSWGSEQCWSLPVWVLASYSLTLQPQELPFSLAEGRRFLCGDWVAIHCALRKQMVEERMFFLSFLWTQQLKPRWDENPGPLNGFSFPPLNLGNAETGYLTQANLLSIARRVGADWQSIGLNLGLTYQQIERIGYNNRWDRTQ